MKLTRDQIEALREGVTQGPWRSGSHHSRTGVYAEGDRLIANTHGHMSNLNWEKTNSENEANQTLIAAAPDLAETALAALDRAAELEAALRGLLATIAAPPHILREEIELARFPVIAADTSISRARAALEPKP